MTDMPLDVVPHRDVKYFDDPLCASVQAVTIMTPGGAVEYAGRSGACGACCMNTHGLPPFEMVEDGDNEIERRFRRSSPAFADRLLGLGDYFTPVEPTDDRWGKPCVMLDLDERSATYRMCKIYKDRPERCGAGFKVGNPQCVEARHIDGIIPSNPLDLPGGAVPTPPPDRIP